MCSTSSSSSGFSLLCKLAGKISSKFSYSSGILLEFDIPPKEISPA